MEHANSGSMCHALDIEVCAALNDKTEIFARHCINAQVINM